MVKPPNHGNEGANAEIDEGTSIRERVTKRDAGCMHAMEGYIVAR